MQLRNIFLILIVISLAFENCSKIDWNLKKLATITTNPVVDIAGNSAKSGGTITDEGGSKITSTGICWSKNPNPKVYNSFLETSVVPSLKFNSIATNLELNTVYYVRSWAVNDAGISYGNEISFTTSKSIDLPLVKTLPPKSILSTDATCTGLIINNQ